MERLYDWFANTQLQWRGDPNQVNSQCRYVSADGGVRRRQRQSGQQVHCGEPSVIGDHEQGHAHFVAEPLYARPGGDFRGEDFVARCAKPFPGFVDGETIAVNRNGSLICTSALLRVEMKTQIHVIFTDKRAPARVVYVDPERPRVCGIGLAQPENIWGIVIPA